MLFEATHTHKATQCPLLTSEGKAMLKNMFSEENMKKSGVKIAAAYMSCPTDTGANHKGYFTIDADSPITVSKYFGPMTVEIRPVKPLSEVAKML